MCKGVNPVKQQLKSFSNQITYTDITGNIQQQYFQTWTRLDC